MVDCTKPNPIHFLNPPPHVHPRECTTRKLPFPPINLVEGLTHNSDSRIPLQRRRSWVLHPPGLALASEKYISAIGDPGMKNPNVRVGLEAWNFCNEVGAEAPKMGSPRLADCADLYCPLIVDSLGCTVKCEVHHKVNESDNSLGAGNEFPVTGFKSYTDPDLFAVEKELYLGSLCEVQDSSNPWHFWMIMLKSGNFDKNTTLCPENGNNVSKIITGRNFPCFGEGCMNQPLVYHNYSTLVSSEDQTVSLAGGFYGTYDLDADLSKGTGKNSYFSVSWKKNLSTGSWIFSQRLTTSSNCWKNNGEPCDGNVLTDVTRYSEMIINPATTSWCRPDNLVSCPPYHVSPTGKKIYRNETSQFPYSAYHLYCSPGNAKYWEEPYDICDPYSNPQAQELVQILPHPEWAVHGYPEKKGDVWIGDPRTWVLEVGALSSRLYFYQDPGTKPARRIWSSLNVGTEIYVSPAGVTAEWTVSDFDVLVPEHVTTSCDGFY